MKKVCSFIFAAALLLTSCSSYTANGAMIGSSVGSVVGSMTNSSHGTGIGSLVGMAAGAAIGASVEKAQTNKAMRGEETLIIEKDN
ncbi:MAG: YMGG-like glycine zipper-containing protein [Bacteroidales bacterium]|nr:YMGG-like glycine zipper-containing protein [Bacteroidales bacterium]